MAKPACPQNKPYIMELAPGTYWWCSCGKSAKQPFCDGAHQGSGFSPVKLEVTSAEKIGLCGCKRTKNAPRCDGSHNQ